MSVRRRLDRGDGIVVVVVVVVVVVDVVPHLRSGRVRSPVDLLRRLGKLGEAAVSDVVLPLHPPLRRRLLLLWREDDALLGQHHLPLPRRRFGRARQHVRRSRRRAWPGAARQRRRPSVTGLLASLRRAYAQRREGLVRLRSVIRMDDVVGCVHGRRQNLVQHAVRGLGGVGFVHAPQPVDQGDGVKVRFEEDLHRRGVRRLVLLQDRREGFPLGGRLEQLGLPRQARDQALVLLAVDVVKLPEARLERRVERPLPVRLCDPLVVVLSAPLELDQDPLRRPPHGPAAVEHALVLLGGADLVEGGHPGRDDADAPLDLPQFLLVLALLAPFRQRMVIGVSDPDDAFSGDDIPLVALPPEPCKGRGFVVLLLQLELVDHGQLLVDLLQEVLDVSVDVVDVARHLGLDVLRSVGVA